MQQSISIGFLQSLIIEYYDQLKSTIDIEIENYIRENHSESRNEIEKKRKNWISKIESTQNDNLRNLENKNLSLFAKNGKSLELINGELFENGFLFFTKKKIDQNPENIFIGKLIYKNGHISEFSRRKFE